MLVSWVNMNPLKMKSDYQPRVIWDEESGEYIDNPEYDEQEQEPLWPVYDEAKGG